MAQSPMTTNTVALHFSGVPKDFDETALMEFIQKKFEKDVQISSVNVCKDWNTRKSRGSAYVNAPSDAAVKIINVLNHMKCDDGSELNITFKYHEPPPQEANLYIGNLNVATTYDDFARIFSSDPGLELVSCKLKELPKKKYGFAQYKTIDDAKKILELDGENISGQPVQIKPFVPRAQRALNSFRTVYVKNFEKVSIEELESIFSKYGPLESTFIFATTKEHDGVTTYSASVTFREHADAVKAIEDLNGKQFPSQKTPVEVVRFMTKMQRKKESKNKIHKPELNLYLAGLSDSTTIDQLRKYMEQYGEIDSVRIMADDDGKSKNYGYCSFVNLDSVNRAKGANGTLINGVPISIKQFMNAQQRRQGRKPAQSAAIRSYKNSKHQHNNVKFLNKHRQNVAPKVTPASVAQPAKPQMLIDPIPKAEFEAMDDEDKHETFGEKIYEFVQQNYPGENPGKITGMILESFKSNYTQLNNFIANRKIIDKINEAIEVLKKHAI